MAQIEKVTYEKIFPLAAYINEKIGVSYLLSETDDPKVVLQAAKDLCEEFHKESNNWPLPHIEERIIPDIQVDGLPKPTSLIEDINSCTDIKVLESYRLIVKSNATLRQAYNKKLEELSINKPSK